MVKQYILQPAKGSDEVNRKCRPRNTMVQLSSPYTDSKRHITQRYTDRLTDRQTTVPRQSYCMRSAKSS